MKIYLIGMGCGADSVTQAAGQALAEAGLVLGPRRLLDQVDKRSLECEYREAVRPEAIMAQVSAYTGDRVCILLSGDSGFYSGARRLDSLLVDYEVEILPGISSLQLLAARLGRPWQDWKLCSVHGVDCDPVAAVCSGQVCFFLTGGRVTPATLCEQLRDAGLGQLAVVAGEDLGSAQERITCGTAAEFAVRDFAPLSVLLAEPAPRHPRRTPGLPDELFFRQEKIPMTKQEIRAAALSKLAVGPEDVCWDVGAGTGSVSVELALQGKSVWAVERDAAALELAEKNREKFGAWNLQLLYGEAPEALAKLPRPDAVFVGGSGGKLREILSAAVAANPSARICVAAIALETLQEACTGFQELGFSAEVTQIAVNRSKATGSLHLMLAQNPVYLIIGKPS